MAEPFMDYESIVVTRLTYYLGEEYSTRFPDLQVVTDDLITRPSKWPTVWVRAIQQVERDRELEGDRIVGVMSTFQIEVYDNANQENAKDVGNSVTAIMKGMAFDGIQLTEKDEVSGVWRVIGRYRRYIAADDVL